MDVRNLALELLVDCEWHQKDVEYLTDTQVGELFALRCLQCKLGRPGRSKGKGVKVGSGRIHDRNIPGRDESEAPGRHSVKGAM